MRLDRAKKLLGGLGGEKQRWADSVQQVCVRLQWCSSSTVRVGGRRGFLTRFGCVPCRVDQLDRDGINLIGDVLVASASIAYAGPFTHDFREALVTKCSSCTPPTARCERCWQTLPRYGNRVAILCDIFRLPVAVTAGHCIEALHSLYA